MVNTIYFEIPIMAISLISLPVTLNNIFMQSRHKVVVGTKKTMFVLQLLSSSLWITLGVMNKQWFMLLSASNNIVQTLCILYVIDCMNKEIAANKKNSQADDN
jgi:hypothetical protein